MNTHESSIRVAIADDHALFRKAIAKLVDSFDDCTVITEVSSGKALIEQIEKGTVPDIILLDLNMPVMNGYETAGYLQKKYPNISILMLTMYHTEHSMMKLIDNGVKGFLKKDCHPSEIHTAIQEVMAKGYYYSYDSAGKLASLLRCEDREAVYYKNVLNPVEQRFLQLACSELTYKEIASIMGITPRGVDAIRDNIFHKLNVRSRVGMVMYACRAGIYM